MPNGSNLVQTWLSTIGLSEQIIETFDAAGIVNPKDLAELEVNHFPALGVKEPGDRKKLFYLIQRVKMSVPADEDDDDEFLNSLDDSVRTMNQSKRSEYSKPLENIRRDGLDGGLGDSFERDDIQDVSDVPSDEKASSPKSPAKSEITSQEKQVMSPYANKREEMFLKRRNERLKQLSPTKTRQPSNENDKRTDTRDASSMPPVRRGTDDSEPKGSLNKRSLNKSKKSNHEPGGVSAESMPATRSKTNEAIRNRSKNIGSRFKNARDKDSDSECSMNEADGIPNSRSSYRDTSRPTHRKNGSLDDGFNDPQSRNKSYSATRAYEVKDRKSRLQAPSARDQNRLSTIPSERPAIMSPLKIKTDDIDNFVKDDASVASISSASSRRSTNNRRRTSSADERKRRQTIASSTRPKSSSNQRQSSVHEFSTAKNRVAGADDSSSVSTTNTDQKKNGVYVHGTKKDNSWTAQVNALREAQQQLYEEHMKNVDMVRDSCEEMRIRVVIRKRPMSKAEASKKDDLDVIHPLRYGDYGRILLYQPKTRVDLTKEVEPLPFAFDNVFGEDSHNCEIYDETIKPLIPGAFEGRWASVFAYGQTGSGKTFTMMGSTLTGIKARTTGVDHNKNLGLYVLAARDIFKFSKSKEYSHLAVGCSLFEIYGGRLFDLLNDRKQVKCLENHKGRVCFPGLSEHPISSAEELMSMIEAGSSNRSTGSTSANRDSSRSHAVLQLHIRKNVNGKHIEHGRLSFIDLAGSERGADTNEACRTTRLEGADINTSLLALKEVIRALATGDSMTHIPFRGSKLTQVLKESFVGKNARTVMVACVAPNMTNCDHTLNTLRYADRVKERNSDTGKLTAAVAAASQIDIQNQGRNEIVDPELIDENDDDNDSWLSDLDKEVDDDVYESYGDIHDEGLDELNEVLKSPMAKSHSERFFRDESPGRNGKAIARSKKEAVQPLINTHRSIMTDMLSMVKQEMTLVNCTDADRELIEEYLEELEEIQDKQLSMISALRESLVNYYSTRPSRGPDDSFDDLRSPI
jgi:kinesin family protein 2/24